MPLREALTALGEPEVALMAETLDALIVQAARVEGDRFLCSGGEVHRAQVLSRLRRLIGGYLALG